MEQLALPYIRASLLMTHGITKSGLKIAEAAILSDKDLLIDSLLAHIHELTKRQVEVQQNVLHAMDQLERLRQDTLEDEKELARMSKEVRKLKEENDRLRSAQTSDVEDMRQIWIDD